MGTQLLGIGLTGPALTDLERRIIGDVTPYAIVLFGRNIASPEQLRELIAEIKSIAKKPPVFMMDQEGGRVDRLRKLVPNLPSAQSFDEGADAEELAGMSGRVIGKALRWLDVEVDLAPVVDVPGDVASEGLERRTFSNDPERVAVLAGAFMRGLHATGTASCLKHFPGIGLGSADSHYSTTTINLSEAQLLARDLVPYKRLANEAGAVMIGHGTYPQIDPGTPATVSYRISTELLRGTLGFDGLAVSDDMEMHAVSDLGAYEMIADRAVVAGNDVISFCSRIERVLDLKRHLRQLADTNAEFRARFDQAIAHGERYRAHIARLRAAAPPPVARFDDIRDEAARLAEEMARTRTRRETVVPQKTGRSGREEWT
ncbi:MAG TPA: beta-N-acetylhexosaminidase [Thermoanaerobaculia bacterium]|nr:beta-N-acetylhexosaminidase [Thermoanaerobaculia bacterium]